MLRTATLDRKTNETHIKVFLSLDGGSLPTELGSGIESQHSACSTVSQNIHVNTGIGFLDHV